MVNPIDFKDNDLKGLKGDSSQVLNGDSSQLLHLLISQKQTHIIKKLGLFAKLFMSINIVTHLFFVNS